MSHTQENEIKKAIELLKQGDVVAIPTETVYGLAASIESEEGLKKIFSIKERPFFDPLIVHVSNISMAKELASFWPKSCDVLTETFWPGPLTIVTRKNQKVSDLITSGLESVGLRCPSHPIALELIEKFGVPVAAPSANKFKRTSPTKKSHVHDEFGDEVFALEGGESEIGIESTVAGVFEDRIEVYRPGMITPEMIQAALEKAGLQLPVRLTQSPVAPGQLKHHYMPKIPVIISWDSQEPDLSKLDIPQQDHAKWIVREAPEQAARKLYSFFRESEQEGRKAIVIVLDSRYRDDSSWSGVLNRLDKAKTYEI